MQSKQFSSSQKFLCAKNCCLYCFLFADFCFVSCFLLVLLFCIAKIFLHRTIEIVLIASFYSTTYVYPPQPAYRELFFTKFFYWHPPIFNCINRKCENFVIIYEFCVCVCVCVCVCACVCVRENIFLCVCENLIEPYLSVRISFCLMLSVRIFSYLCSSVIIFQNIFLLFTVFMKISKCMNTII